MDREYLQNRLKVLYVTQNTQASSQSVLENYFLHLETLKTQKSLENILSSQHIDIVICDKKIHGTSAFKIIESLKFRYSDTLWIVLAHEETLEDYKLSLSLGIDELLLTPIDESDLNQTLKKLASKLSAIEQNHKNKEDINLLRQYQEITDKSTIVSKTDIFGKIIYANKNFCDISEYSQEELLGKNHNIVRHPDNPKEIYKTMWDTIKVDKQEWNGILKNISKTGKTYYVKSTVKPILDNNGDIVEFIALRDNISAVMSDKKHLLDMIDSMDLALLVLIQIEEHDMLEKFYNISTVDQVEKMFGYKLLSYLPKEYIFENVYTLGDGRYALVTDFNSFLASEININEYLENLIKNVKDSVLMIDDIEFDLNIALSYSFGKYMLYEDAKSGLEEAISSQSAIMCSNDLSNKIQQDAKKNLDIIKMVKIALESYKIISYFQPIINNKTKEVEKYESLVRLIDEEGSVLSPAKFLNVTKKGNYYNKITKRVLSNSFRMLKYINTKLSINLSAPDIEKKKTREEIFKLLDEYHEDNNRIIFELLEDENVKKLDEVVAFIKEVKKRGVKIAVDDFGAGYSNFERLLKFEPDILKIDGSLIKNITSDTYSKDIVETIVKFAQKQNIETIAEFVETEEIFEMLRELGVDYSQGYYFGKPQNLDEQSFN